MGTHTTEEPLGKVRTRENEAEGAERVSDVPKATWVALVSSTTCNSVTPTVFQKQPLYLPNLSRGQWVRC